MILSYFIYYHAAPEHAAAIAPRIRAMQAEVQAMTGVAGRLLQKDDASITWMEIYEGVADSQAFEAGLERACLRAGLQGPPVIDGERQVERFTAVE